MLECIYCTLHVLSASPLAALAKSSGTTKTMRVECVIHVSLRMYILVMSISISFYSIYFCCDEKSSSIALFTFSLFVYLGRFLLMWSNFQLCGLFAMWSIFDFLIVQRQFLVLFSTFTVLFASVCCMRLQFCAIPASTW
jgi:hypothetical protein